MADITAPAPNPAQKFRAMIEASVGREVEAMLAANPAAVAQAKARVAIAFRDAAQANPQLLECSPASVVRAVLMTVVTGLAPGGVNPTCYLTSRYNKKAGCNEVQWSASHRGLIQLASRSGYGVKAVSVHAEDEFDLDLSAIRPPKHRPGAVRTWDNLMGCYVVIFRLDTGSFVGWEWIDRAQIEARREQSDAWRRGQRQGSQDWERSSPWYKWPVEMALKTAIKWAAARGVLPTDDALGRAMEMDAEDAVVVEAAAEAVQVASRQIAHDPLSVLDRMPESAPERVEVPVPPVLEFHADLAEKAQEVLRMEGELDPARVLALRQEAGISGPVASDAVLERYRAALLKAIP